MKKRLIQFNHEANAQAKSLKKSIQNHLARYFKDFDFSSSDVQQWISRGDVYIGEKVCKNPNLEVKAKAQISFWTKSLSYNFNLSQCIVFEDEYLIAFDKPSGLPTQATLDPKREHLFNHAIALLTNRQPQKLAYVGLHHRLDQDTSGVVLMTKKKSANKGIGDLFKNQQIQKQYLALVELGQISKDPPNHWKIRDHLKKTPNKSHRFFFASTNSGGQLAETKFETIKNLNGKALIRAWPKTGRTHQIRVHLSEYGFPIIGDRVYGKNSQPSERLHLHCSQLEFVHPLTEQKIIISAPTPKEFA